MCQFTPYYSPTIGRFISEDTDLGKANDPLSLNLYTYCQNDPVNHFDPTGNTLVDIGFISFDLTNLIMNPSMANLGWLALDVPCLLDPTDISDIAIHAARGAKAAVRGVEAAKDVEELGKAGLGEYGRVGGHHVHAKAAFKGEVSYDLNKGFSISQKFMEENGLNHVDMTTKQIQLFKELNESGRPNTLEEHTRIAKEALIAGGATEEQANRWVQQSLENLTEQGVTQPSGIPWY